MDTETQQGGGYLVTLSSSELGREEFWYDTEGESLEGFGQLALSIKKQMKQDGIRRYLQWEGYQEERP